jgi:8-amino-7-oxononanoate synthase
MGKPDHEAFGEALRRRLERRRAEGLYRGLSPRGPERFPLERVGGRLVVNFCSNDYLGLGTHPRVLEAFREAAGRWGVGAGASHLVSGHTEIHAELERRLAAWTGRERALVFSTGFMANLGTLTALVGPGDAVFQDRLNHASLLDAGRASGARMHRYRDPEHLERLLERVPARRRLVVTDGVFSMDGVLAPLPELVDLCRRFDAWLMVDDAHGLGVIGPGGRGSTARWGLTQDDVPVIMGTFGKALGGFGAFVAGPEVLVEALIQEAIIR